MTPTAAEPVDIVVPFYNERVAALGATVGACLRQSAQVNAVWIVDDGSDVPVEAQSIQPQDARLHVLRLERNRGVSAARMAGVSKSDTEFIACVNVDVIPAPDWVATCIAYLRTHRQVGAVYTPLIPAAATALLSRWRMRFQEVKFDRPTGPASFAPGHAVLFRHQALSDVGGYSIGMPRGEDSDICERMWAVGWATHFTAQSGCISIQTDTLRYLARKQLFRDGQDPTAEVFWRTTRSLGHRLGRNLLARRLPFVPVDLAVYALELGFLARARATNVGGARPEAAGSALSRPFGGDNPRP
jgi:glycosyltransferase involved in cell wall biosynthesis